MWEPPHLLLRSPSPRVPGCFQPSMSPKGDLIFLNYFVLLFHYLVSREVLPDI